MSKAIRGDSPVGANSPRDYKPRVKRTRIALACVRCRTRKQKCDGAQPLCSTCERLGLQCHYKPHVTPKPDQKKMYIAALEEHIAGLERLLSESGYDQVTVDHWKKKRHQIRHDSQRQDYSVAGDYHTLPATTKDPIWNAIIDSDTDGMRLRGLFSPTNMSSPESPACPRAQNSVALLVHLAPPNVASLLLDGWIKHMSTQYPIIHTPLLKKLQSKPVDILDGFEISLLHIIYANSGRILEAIGDHGDFRPEDHYEAAIQNMDTVLGLRDIRSVQYLLLLALYSLRSPRNPGAWALAGLAVRQCIELGLHRKTVSAELSTELELEVRIFWSCYYLDRGVSVALGRPPAISDSDIDVDFPLDIDEDVDNIETIQLMAANRTQLPMSPPSSLTPFIHLLRLRMIESKIEHLVYRVHKKSRTDPALIQAFLNQLTEWKSAIPREYFQTNRKDGLHGGVDAFMIPYYKCVRLLLYSQLSTQDIDLQYLKICADACAGLCAAYKRLNRMSRVDCSPLALQSLFICGVTLLYCVWLAPPGYLDVMSAISDCNLMLYVMDERSPTTQKYLDVFERVKMNVLDVVEKDSIQGRRESGVLDADITGRCRSLEQGMLDTVRTDYEQIISDLAKKTDDLGLGDAKPSPFQAFPEGGAQMGDPDYTTSPQWQIGSGPGADYEIDHTFGTYMEPTFNFDLHDFHGFDMVPLEKEQTL